MRELTFVEKKKVKKVYQLTEQEFRSGKWCSDKSIIPEGEMVELTYTQRNGILIVHNTLDLKIKTLNESEKERLMKEESKNE